VREEIISIMAFIDLNKIGTQLAALYGMRVWEDKTSSVKSALLKSPAVGRVSTTNGRFNVVCVATFSRVSDMAEFQMKFIPHIDGVSSFESMMYLFPQTSGNYKLTELDRNIYRLLKTHGRLPSTEIAHRLGLSPDTVRVRLNRLVSRDRIFLVRAIVNSEKAPGSSGLS